MDLEMFEEALIITQGEGLGENSIASRYLCRHFISLIIIVYIKIVGNSTVPLTLCSFQLNLLWKDSPASLLPDPADLFAPLTYRFPGQSGEQFDRSDVIVQSGKTLRRGQSVEGFLLAYDGDPIPNTFRHGSNVPVVLNIADQFGGIYSKELSLRADRSVEWRPKPQPARPRRRLFDQPDSTQPDFQRLPLRASNGTLVAH
jgi:hypothetical protein